MNRLKLLLRDLFDLPLARTEAWRIIGKSLDRNCVNAYNVTHAKHIVPKRDPSFRQPKAESSQG